MIKIQPFARACQLISPIALLGMGFLVTGNSYAQGSNEDIIVTGNKEKVEVYKKIISDQFVVRGGGKNGGQYARFAQSICPSVSGFSEENSKILEKEIRAVIAQTKVRLAKKGCSENMLVIAVDSGSETIKSLRQNQKRLFSSLSAYDSDQLMNSTGPVFTWKSVQTMSSDSKGNAKEGTITAKAGLGSLGPQSFGGQRSHVKSKIKKSTVEGVSYSYLLIERGSLKNVTFKQLAGHVTMLSLIDMKPGSGTAAPPSYSILSLFDQDDPALRPPAIGDVDVALLNALYSSPGNVRASAQRSAMVHRINKQLDRNEE